MSEKRTRQGSGDRRPNSGGQRSDRRRAGRHSWNKARRRVAERTSAAGPEADSEVTTGRQLALAAVIEHDRTGRFLSEILGSHPASESLPARERAAALDISGGVIRRRRTLRRMLMTQLSRDPDNVESGLWRLLELGCYLLTFTRTPAHSAVDESVKLARWLQCPRWTGFVNGILRNVGRMLSDEETDEPGAGAVPLASGAFRRLNADVFADPSEDPVRYTADAYSLPVELAQRWQQRMTAGQLTDAALASVSVPAVTLRVNPIRSDTAAVMSALQDAGTDAEITEHGLIRLRSSGAVGELPGYREGWWCVQDPSAAAASQLTAPQAGERILDLCAAPGGKSTHLAELSRDAASITACDVSRDRLELVAENAGRLGLHSIQTQLVGHGGEGIPPEPFDAVLVDAPCSNSGVLSRRPEARWKFGSYRPEAEPRTEECDRQLTDLAQLQMKLLLTAFSHVRPGGRIIYSTCSIEPEETDLLVRDAVRGVRGLRIVREQLHLPGPSGDGAFQCLLQRDQAT